MIEQLSIREAANLTPEDQEIFWRGFKRFPTNYSIRMSDRADAAHMFMLASEGPGAARYSVGVSTNAPEEKTPTYWGSGL